MSSDSELVLLDIDEHIATITLNNPEKHNVLTNAAIAAFQRCLQSVSDSKARVLIITGRGERSFCSGASLEEMNAGTLKAEDFPDLTEAVARMPIPKICALNGSVYGGGSELALSCDFRIGVPGMRMFVPPARIGLCYPISGIQRFVNILGANAAKRLLVASEEFNAEGLLDIGFLTQLSERDTLLDDAEALARRIAAYAPLAVQAMMKISDQFIHGNHDAHHAHALFQRCSDSNDLAEGLASVAEKRAPVFTGS